MEKTVVYQSRVKRVSTASGDVNLLKKLIKPTSKSNDLLIKKKSPKKAVVVQLKQGQRIKITPGIIDPEDRKKKITVNKNEDKIKKVVPVKSLQSPKIPVQMKSEAVKESKLEEEKENKPKENNTVKMFAKKRTKRVTFDENSIASSKVLSIKQPEVFKKTAAKKFKLETATEIQEKKAVKDLRSEALPSFRNLRSEKTKKEAEEKKFVRVTR